MPRRSAKRDGSHPVDIHVGLKIREARGLQGKSQEWLGEQLGLTFQQVQKYERGANRVSASRLWEVAKIFNVPVSHFFEGCEDGNVVAIAGNRDLNVMERRETLEMVRVYYRLDRKVRSHLLTLLRGFLSDDTDQEPRKAAR